MEQLLTKLCVVRAQTVLRYFQQGVLDYGLPDYVRSDHGGENVDVWRLFLCHNWKLRT